MKKKGFTLIELLAVIVILAIIAIIAVPVILNVIEKSKIGAAEQSAQGYVDAVEKQIVTNKVKNENLIEEGEYTKAELDEKNVKIKGEITDVVLVVGEKGRVTQARFCINGYSIDYDGKKATKNSEANYCSEIASILNPCPYELNQVFNFDYTGDIQEFTAQCDGKYKLEVWGAQGGSVNSSTSGGLGAYSYGNYTIDKNSTIYIVVGGKGEYYTDCTYCSKPGGYNGGGGSTSYSHQGGSGGGATHIATRTGLLSSLESYKSDILIVAGGGGGGSISNGTTDKNGSGGAGGGYQGGSGQGSNGTVSSGNQSNGFSFGQGQTGSYNGQYYCEGGGGGGYYGGYAGTNSCWSSGGAGGSGYLNTTKLTEYGMYCYTANSSLGYSTGCPTNSTYNTYGTTNYSSTATANYAKQGNGYARITYLGEE